MATHQPEEPLNEGQIKSSDTVQDIEQNRTRSSQQQWILVAIIFLITIPLSIFVSSSTSLTAWLLMFLPILAIYVVLRPFREPIEKGMDRLNIFIAELVASPAFLPHVFTICLFIIIASLVDSSIYNPPIRVVVVPITFTEFPINTQGSGPLNIVSGRDGNLWFTESYGNQIGRISPNGVIQEFSASDDPSGIIVGPDGNVWFSEFAGDKIGRITSEGKVTEFSVPGGKNPTLIAVGRDGNLWFSDNGSNSIWRMTTKGIITGRFIIPTAGSSPIGMTSGPDGNLWFVERGGNKIGRITTTGVFTGEFPIPTANSKPGPLVVGPDGNLWFAELNGNKIACITTTGVIILEAAIPTPNSTPDGITIGPDNNLWFTEKNGNKVGYISLKE